MTVPHLVLFAAALGLGAAAGAFAADDARVFRFGKEDLGRLPTGWKADRTGQGEGSVWKVVADASGPAKTGYVLAQTAEGPGPLFNLCVAEDTRYQDLEITVAFKAVAGDKDQGGGPVWRYQDANNYYIARMNPLEKNYRGYKVVAGKRTQLATKEGLDVPYGEWHTLKVRHVGDHIECYLDGTKHLEARDPAFAKPGKLGLWTKADARTCFDDLQVREIGK